MVYFATIHTSGSLIWVRVGFISRMWIFPVSVVVERNTLRTRWKEAGLAMVRRSVSRWTGHTPSPACPASTDAPGPRLADVGWRRCLVSSSSAALPWWVLPVGH